MDFQGTYNSRLFCLAKQTPTCYFKIILSNAVALLEDIKIIIQQR